MDDLSLMGALEAVLFAWGDGLKEKDLCKILSIDKKTLRALMTEMKKAYQASTRGIEIIQYNDTYQIATKKEFFDYISLLGVFGEDRDKGLSGPAMETLSIIAYKQPIIKSEIEAIRGVKCDKTIETLLSKGLIEEVARLEKIGRPILYGTTDVFLRTFSLESLDDLPKIEDNNEERSEQI